MIYLILAVAFVFSAVDLHHQHVTHLAKQRSLQQAVVLKKVGLKKHKSVAQARLDGIELMDLSERGHA